MPDAPEADIAALGDGVVAAFYSVAYADGKLQYPESNAFGMMLKQGSQLGASDAALTARVFRALDADLAAAVGRVERRLASGETFAQMLEEARAVLERVPRSQADTLVASVITTLRNVGGVYPIFARGPSREETAAIDMIAAALGVARPADRFAPFQD